MDAVKDIPVEPGRDTAAGRALLEGKAVHIADVCTDPDYSFDAQKLDTYRTIIGIPMLREGICIFDEPNITASACLASPAPCLRIFA
jgi:hypothetical protein